MNHWLYYEFILSALIAREEIPYPNPYLEPYLQDLRRCHLISIVTWIGKYTSPVEISPAGMAILKAMRDPDFVDTCGQDCSLPDLYRMIIGLDCKILPEDKCADE